MLSDDKRVELRANYQAFKKILPTLLDDHRGEFALMRHREIVGYFARAGEAWRHGCSAYRDELFSVQEVTDVPADFGWFSRVPGQLSV